MKNDNTKFYIKVQTAAMRDRYNNKKVMMGFDELTQHYLLLTSDPSTLWSIPKAELLLDPRKFEMMDNPGQWVHGLFERDKSPATIMQIDPPSMTGRDKPLALFRDEQGRKAYFIWDKVKDFMDPETYSFHMTGEKSPMYVTYNMGYYVAMILPVMYRAEKED